VFLRVIVRYFGTLDIRGGDIKILDQIAFLAVSGIAGNYGEGGRGRLLIRTVKVNPPIERIGQKDNVDTSPLAAFVMVPPASARSIAGALSRSDAKRPVQARRFPSNDN